MFRASQEAWGASGSSGSLHGVPASREVCRGSCPQAARDPTVAGRMNSFVVHHGAVIAESTAGGG
eukprot:4660719-Lingulodinium_polyedra.AAC.1